MSWLNMELLAFAVFGSLLWLARSAAKPNYKTGD